MNASRLSDFLTLCKPRVVLLMLATAWVGMIFASPTLMSLVIWQKISVALMGIAFCAASAAVINHLVDRRIDAIMLRTQTRPLASGRIKPLEAFLFSIIVGGIGVLILFFFVNTLTTLLSLFTVFGYAVFYTLFLKRATPQNIVIGGIAGAMPPLLGWASISNTITPQALLLVSIIFVWTPPHFWALAIHRSKDYQKANIPMLPVTHGVYYTTLSIILYTVLLLIITLFPYLINMNGIFYLISAMILRSLFLFKAIQLHRSSIKDLSRMALNTFNFSIVYLLLLFIALLIDRIFKGDLL